MVSDLSRVGTYEVYHGGDFVDNCHRADPIHIPRLALTLNGRDQRAVEVGNYPTGKDGTATQGRRRIEVGY